MDLLLDELEENDYGKSYMPGMTYTSKDSLTGMWNFSMYLSRTWVTTYSSLEKGPSRVESAVHRCTNTVHTCRIGGSVYTRTMAGTVFAGTGVVGLQQPAGSPVLNPNNLGSSWNVFS
jgi:hypothetical protein